MLASFRADPERRRTRSHSISRRTFLKGTAAAGGIALLAGAALVAESSRLSQPVSSREPILRKTVSLRVNGKDYMVEVEPRDMLVDVLRDRLNLMGTKRPCNRAECGGCSVIVNGQLQYSCTIPAIRMEGAEILTVEGYDVDPVIKTLQMSNWYEDAAQCASCVPGFIMAATALLKRNLNPSVDEIRCGLSGNLCRCGTYYNQIRAVQRASRTLRGI